MLNKEAQKKLMKAMGYSDEDIATAVDTDDEQDVTIPDGIKVYNAKQYTDLEKNLKKKGRDEGIKAQKEIAVKDLKSTFGVEYDGEDMAELADAIKEHVIAEAKIAPDEGKKTYEKKLKAAQEALKAKDDAIAALTSEKSALARDNEWRGKFPANRVDSMSDEDRMLLLKNKLTVKDEDGKQVFFYKGQRLEDETQNDLSLDAAIAHVFNSEKWISEAAPADPKKIGRGQHDPAKPFTGKPMSTSEASQLWEQQGKKAEGAEFQAHITALKKENADFKLE